MMRLLYRMLVVTALPFAATLFAVRGLRGYPGERHGLLQRFGFGRRQSANAIWIHAVSVGEVQAAVALVRSLRDRYPNIPLTMTTTTGTGATRAREAFGDVVDIRFLPFDSLGCVRRFLNRVQPRIAIIVEKELWPNLYGECAARGIPLVIASATISARAERRMQKLAPLFRDVLAKGVRIAAQSEADAERFRRLGVVSSRVQVIGNLKFDLTLSAQLPEQGVTLRRRCGWQDRVLLVGGSTYELEESALLEAQRRLRREGIDMTLVLAPRHPSRFESVAARLQSDGVVYARRSQLETNSTRPPDVLLLDTLGELMGAYAAADLAFVGGSLVTDVGGHNLIEPAALGIPTIAGPYVYNALEVGAALRAAGALTMVMDTESLIAEVRSLVTNKDERSRRGALGKIFVEDNRGTLERLLAYLEPLMAESLARSPTTNR
jgi:3-deoxy-D-manno-octulosonic-acid transferase